MRPVALLPHPLHKVLKIFVRITTLIPRKVENKLKVLFFKTPSIDLNGK